MRNASTDAPMLDYAPPVPAARGQPSVVFALSVIYLIAIWVLAWPDLSYLAWQLQQLDPAPRGDPYVLCEYVNLFILEAIAAANVLAVIAFGRAAVGRPARRLLKTYLLIESGLLTIHWIELIYRSARSPYADEQGGKWFDIGMGETLWIMPLIQAAAALPFVVLLISKCRRAGHRRAGPRDA